MPITCDDVLKKFDKAKTAYDGGQNNIDDFAEIGALALEALANLKAQTVKLGTKKIGKLEVEYQAYSYANTISRPYRRDLFIADVKTFKAIWANLRTKLDTKTHSLAYDKTNEAIYTATTAFAIMCDLHRKGVKIPGTFFENIVGAIIGHLSGRERGKHITLPEIPAPELEKVESSAKEENGNADEDPLKSEDPLTTGKVTTDIVLLGKEQHPDIVIAAKISTRERIVQVFAHTRIISYYVERDLLKPHKFLLICVSETQRLRDKFQDTCVPRQVALYQKFVSPMDGIYYLDPPPPYLKLAEKKLVNIKTIAEFLAKDLAIVLKETLIQAVAQTAPSP